VAEQSAQHVADERGQSRLAGSASTDEAFQAVGQFEFGFIEESPDDRDAPDPV